jgi:hypothetical protein
MLNKTDAICFCVSVSTRPICALLLILAGRFPCVPSFLFLLGSAFRRLLVRFFPTLGPGLLFPGMAPPFPSKRLFRPSEGWGLLAWVFALMARLVSFGLVWWAWAPGQTIVEHQVSGYLPERLHEGENCLSASYRCTKSPVARGGLTNALSLANAQVDSRGFQMDAGLTFGY